MEEAASSDGTEEEVVPRSLWWLRPGRSASSPSRCKTRVDRGGLCGSAGVARPQPCIPNDNLGNIEGFGPLEYNPENSRPNPAYQTRPQGEDKGRELIARSSGSRGERLSANVSAVA